MTTTLSFHMQSTSFGHVLRGLVLAVCGALPVAAADLTVFAAASLRNALEDAVEAYEANSSNHVVLSLAGSSALARQIQNGAPADLFISANLAWMNLLEDERLISADTRVDLLGNQLVLIAGNQTDLSPNLSSPEAIKDALAGGKLAMAQVNAVPAGIYGKAALQHLGLWSAVQTEVAQADNVRAAMRLVALGEAPLGIVYATDVLAEPRVRVVATFPPEAHPPIVYPAAVVAENDTAASRDLLSFLSGKEAATIFAAHGFTAPDGAR